MKKTDLQRELQKLGRQGGKKAAANMTRQQKSDRAKKAIAARWQKKKPSA